MFSPTWYTLHSKCYEHPANIGPTCFLFSQIPLLISVRIEFFTPISDLLNRGWANGSHRPNGNHIPSANQANLLPTSVIHLKCIRDKCGACEENLFLKKILRPHMQELAKDGRGTWCFPSIPTYRPQFWLEYLLST